MNSSFWILLTACLVAVTCGLVGTFLVLRRMVLMGDAISHAVLPGLVGGFLLSGSRDPLVMLLGAGAVGVLTAWLTEWVHRSGRVDTGASMGVVFTFLFALGVILVSAFAGQIDLDPDCVLYGEIAYVAYNTVLWGERDLGPRAVWLLGGALLFNLFLIVAFYKQLKICAFDPELAESLGIRTATYHYLLMIATAITTVAAFESVGAILVVAMLVVPPATALLLTQRLSGVLILASLIGCLSAGLGYSLASAADCSIAGAMAVAAGVLFLLTFLFSPRHGLVTRAWFRQRSLLAEE
ncbi:MAG: metal ABC transporter permease [Candidatus Omnitrophica bacterium]|nr:metal ABC transporter permease [Candidatus Omnitrophota bacterium]